MAKVTQKQALIRALELQGWTIERAGSSSTKMKHSEHNHFYFIGNAGSFRKGRNKAGSMVVNDQLKNALLLTGGYTKEC